MDVALLAALAPALVAVGLVLYVEARPALARLLLRLRAPALETLADAAHSLSTAGAAVVTWVLAEAGGPSADDTTLVLCAVGWWLAMNAVAYFARVALERARALAAVAAV